MGYLYLTTVHMKKNRAGIHKHKYIRSWAFRPVSMRIVGVDDLYHAESIK